MFRPVICRILWLLLFVFCDLVIALNMVVECNLTECIGYFKASITVGRDKSGDALPPCAYATTLAVVVPDEDRNAIGIDVDQRDSWTNGSGAVCSH